MKEPNKPIFLHQDFPYSEDYLMDFILPQVDDNSFCAEINVVGQIKGW